MLAPPDPLLSRSRQQADNRTRSRVHGFTRVLPIRWRILAIAALNSALVLILLALIWNSTNDVGRAWRELEHARQSERLLVSVDNEAGRLQSLIHRYINQPDARVLAEIVDRREPLITWLRVQARLNPLLAEPAGTLTSITEKFLAGFDHLSTLRADISRTYETDVSRRARDMAELHAVVESAVQTLGSPAPLQLGKSREALNAVLMSANAYYLSISDSARAEARRSAEAVEQIASALLSEARDELQRNALTALREQAGLLRRGIERLTEQFAAQTRLLREEIDANAAEMTRAADDLTAVVRRHEQAAKDRFDQILNDTVSMVSLVVLGFVLQVVLVGVGIAKSISDPLHQLRTTMMAIVAGAADAVFIVLPGRLRHSRHRRDGDARSTGEPRLRSPQPR